VCLLNFEFAANLIPIALLGFPAGCVFFKGPHPLECLETVWRDSDCLEEGWKAPANLKTPEMDALDLLNIE